MTHMVAEQMRRAGSHCSCPWLRVGLGVEMREGERDRVNGYATPLWETLIPPSARSGTGCRPRPHAGPVLGPHIPLPAPRPSAPAAVRLTDTEAECSAAGSRPGLQTQQGCGWDSVHGGWTQGAFVCHCVWKRTVLHK